jgi:hypothetical protein
MNWKNVSRDKSPDDGQQVLLSVDGVYYLTIYHKPSNTYQLKDQAGQFFSPGESPAMYWLEIEDPTQGSAES